MNLQKVWWDGLSLLLDVWASTRKTGIAGAGVIWKLLGSHMPVAWAGFGSAGTVDTNM